MALDTKYRPRVYDDVLGQEAAVSVLRQFVIEKRGFHQSYVFSGQHGSGKTTLGRILARALLCEVPVAGNPCDQCFSCLVFLNGGVHECFEELDAASKSGKGDLAKILEDVTYSTFSGRRRIYLFDESHRLSKQALDVLLKPMEDAVEGTEDKKLVCIFCTTEPEKMSSTIFSRCAPGFVIRMVEPEGIAQRLTWVCDQEHIEYDLDALVTIAEVVECHIRDALKTVEGVSMLGKVTRATVTQYLQLGANDLALTILENMGVDLQLAVATAGQMSIDVSPSSAYERIAEAAMTAYRAHLQVGRISTQWGADRIRALAERGAALLGIASRFAAPPYRPTRHTLVLDVSTTHYSLLANSAPQDTSRVVLNVTETLRVSTPPQTKIPSAPEVSSTGTIPQSLPQTAGTGSLDAERKKPEIAATSPSGVWVDPRGIGGGPEKEVPVSGSKNLDPAVFRELVRHHLRDLTHGGT